MHIHPAIAALRSDPARQRRANAAIDAAERAWLSDSSVRRLRSELAAFDAGADDDEESAYLAPANFVEDDRYDPAQMLESADWSSNGEAMLSEALAGIDDRSRDILQQRWLNEEKATLHTLAAQYGVSAERIRQLEKNAMKKVKKLIEA